MQRRPRDDRAKTEGLIRNGRCGGERGGRSRPENGCLKKTAIRDSRPRAHGPSRCPHTVSHRSFVSRCDNSCVWRLLVLLAFSTVIRTGTWATMRSDAAVLHDELKVGRNLGTIYHGDQGRSPPPHGALVLFAANG